VILLPLTTTSLDAFTVDLPAAFQRDVLSLDGDRTVLLHRDARRTGLNRDLIASVDQQFLADLSSIVLHRQRFAILLDAVSPAVADTDRLFLLDRKSFVGAES
jgi:hypothetical protein